MPLFKKDKKEKEAKSSSDDGSGGASSVERSSKLTPEQVESFGAPRSHLVSLLVVFVRTLLLVDKQ